MGVARALAAPLRTLSPMTRLIWCLAAILACGWLGEWDMEHGFVFVVPDSTHYLQIASGDASQVMQPFASRQLGALFVRLLAHGFHLSIEQGFVLESLLSFALIAGAIYWLMSRTLAPRWMLLAVAIAPFWAGQAQYLVLPDLWYSAMLAIMILLLARKHMLLASLMMFPLMLSRESTSLTLLCFLIAAWSSLRWKDRAAAVFSVIAGGLIIGHLTKGTAANVEHLPQAIYLLAKVPWNFMRNVLGLLPWSNVNTDLCTVPRWSFKLPFHPATSVGLCGYSSIGQVFVIQAVLTQFGLLPLLTAFLWWRYRRLGDTPLLRFVLLYGAASYLMAPLLGNWIAHLAGYGWPLFFIALPLLFDKFAQSDLTAKRALAGVGFCVLHLAVWALEHWRYWFGQIVVTGLIWVGAYLLLRIWWPRDSTVETSAY
jgi:hypothetical protein